MPSPELSALRPPLAEIERRRDSRVLVLAAAQMDVDVLPALYDRFLEIGHSRRLDVVLESRDGEAHIARRLGLLLREHCDHLAFLLPYHCAPAATLLSLCADEIIAGSLALISPIDPVLHPPDGSVCTGRDIQCFGEMAEQWFGVDRAEAGTEALALLCNRMFPPALVSFYRHSQLVRQIGQEMLAFQLPALDACARDRIVDALMSAFHSHQHAITGKELRTLGLRVVDDPSLMRHAWDMSRCLRPVVEAGQADTSAMPRKDMLIATRERICVRRQHPSGMDAQWIVENVQ